MTEFKSFTEQEIEDLERCGFEYCADHRCLAPHWLKRESDYMRVTQVGPLHVIHLNVGIDLYKNCSAQDFKKLGLELRQLVH